MTIKSGFTLIETLITLALASLLLVVVWSMFDVYTSIEQKGVSVAEKATVLRAVRQQLRNDLMELARIDSKISSPMNTNRPDLPFYPSNGYLMGTNNELHFIAAIGRGKELMRAVSYSAFVIPPEGRGTSQLDRDQIEEDSYGVARLNRSWIDFQQERRAKSNDFSRFNGGRTIELNQDDFLVIGGDRNPTPANSELEFDPEVRDEIPELSGLRFRYFDNGSWRDQWDSGWHRRLPEAIEVEMVLPDEADDEASRDFGGAYGQREQEPVLRHRFVIALGINSALSTRGAQ